MYAQVKKKYNLDIIKNEEKYSCRKMAWLTINLITCSLSLIAQVIILIIVLYVIFWYISDYRQNMPRMTSISSRAVRMSRYYVRSIRTSASKFLLSGVLSLRVFDPCRRNGSDKRKSVMWWRQVEKSTKQTRFKLQIMVTVWTKMHWLDCNIGQSHYQLRYK